jgi:hypothetical protein
MSASTSQQSALSWPRYAAGPAFYLRRRGSSEPKPVGSAHTATGIEG